MRIQKIFIFLLTLPLLACTAIPGGSDMPTPSPDQIAKEEQAVYSFFLTEVGEPALILQNTSSFLTQTDPEEAREYIESSLDDLSKEALESYLARNSQPGPLAADMNLGVRYVLLTEDQLSEISSQAN